MKLHFISLAALITFGTTAAYTDQTPTVAASPQQNTQQTEQVVHDYLLNHPEVIMQSVQDFQKKQMDQMQDATKAMAAQNVNSLFHQPNDPVAGNPNGKVTLVEFLDYQCGHCIAMTPVVDTLIKSNPDLRVVFKQFPIRGPVSTVAAKAALAANNQGKFMAFHLALIKILSSSQQPLSENDIYKAAETAGLNLGKLKKDMNNKETDKALAANYQLAQNLKLMGTPAFFIGKTNLNNNATATAITYIPGGAEQQQFQSIIDKNKA